MNNRQAPLVMSDLRQEIVHVPKEIEACSGIRIYGRLIKSVIFSTDVAIIANTDADAVLAVYPFTPSPAILKSILSVATIPVLAGVGGGLTSGMRSANMSLLSESEGAMAVVLNAPSTCETIASVNALVDIPIIYTVAAKDPLLGEKIQAGVDILNVSGGPDTPQLVAWIRQSYPDFPMIATGGTTSQSIQEIIAAGANAVSYTPPTNAELFKEKMKKYRQSKGESQT